MPKKSSKPVGDSGALAPKKPVTKNGKATKAVKKPAQKANKKVAQPKITDMQFMAWFMKQKQATFLRMTEEWNEENLKITLKNHADYDGWLNYFKTLPVNKLKILSDTGLDILPAEAYAALSFWRDMMINPSRIKNIHRAGLTTGKQEKTIVDFANANDRLGVLEGIRQMLAKKMVEGTGARDAGQLSAQMMEVMTQIEIYKRRQAPKAETTLGALMSDMGDIKAKRPSKNGGGARHTSFASRVTIEDVEATNG